MTETPSPEESSLLEAEQHIEARLGDRDLDFASMHAIANIYRAAAAVRRMAEREPLATGGLSWGGFSILWVLWVWGEMETAKLAAECELAKGTLTGMVSTLERQGMVVRTRLEHDRRRVLVSLTPQGLDAIERLAPLFNDFEAKMTIGLDDAEKRELSRLLRVVSKNAGRS
jgi:DNA-binding MarR family transcriptional regulator